MKKQIVHISVHQTSKVIAAMHTAMLTALAILPTVLGYWYHGDWATGFIMLFFLPLFMWLFLYIGYVVASWFYNLVVPWTGGIEITMRDVGPHQERALVDASSTEFENTHAEQSITPPTDKKDSL